MSPPIRDGSGSSIGSIRLGDGSEISEVRTGAGEVLFRAVTIPDGSVSRSSDGKAVSESAKRGIRIKVNQDYGKIGVKISSKTSGVSTAYCYRFSDGQLLDTVDISGLQAGDTFAFDANFETGTKYQLVADDGGNSFTNGRNNIGSGTTFSDPSVNIDIVNGAFRKTTTANSYSVFVTVGDVGLV